MRSAGRTLFVALFVAYVCTTSWLGHKIMTLSRPPCKHANTSTRLEPVAPPCTPRPRARNELGNLENWHVLNHTDWRKTYPSRWLRMGVGDVYIEPPPQPPACPALNQDTAWTGNLMWYELRKRVEDCCALCAQRYPCVAFTYRPHDASMCMLYDGAVTARAEPGVISGTLANHPAPPDCRTMGPPCACPQHTWFSTAFPKNYPPLH